jgi:hypothetical protein
MAAPTTSRPLAAISPTRLDRLLACPLRIAFEQQTSGHATAQSSPWAAVGTAIHRTIELVLADEPLDLPVAWEQACDEGAANGTDPRAAPNARRAFLRLQRRLPELLQYIEEHSPTQLLREQVLTTADGVMTGQLDLLLLGERPAIVDHKTGHVLGEPGEPRDSYARQLAIYAGLVDASMQLDIDEAALFSVQDGLIIVDVSRLVRAPIISEALQARRDFNERAPGEQPAAPSDTSCEHCTYVGRCDAAWDALRSGAIERIGWGDAIRGTTRGPIVAAANGSSAVPVHIDEGTLAGDGMLIDVPSELVVDVPAGSPLAAWHLSRRSEDPLTLAFRDGTTQLYVQP